MIPGACASGGDMGSSVSLKPIFRFGLFEADTAGGTLTRNGLRVKIPDQSFRALTLLLENQGKVVSRDQFRQMLWPEGTYVDFDGSLNVILKRLRATIDDDSDNPRFIETVPRRGYRFIAPVSVETRSVDPEVSASPIDRTTRETADQAFPLPQSSRKLASTH
ncbi:MAG: winged helix-turn-helix domain-containing protein, partial [Acidobacteria bacterium]|nr:winged helix-turn-helix domain-containing protein [Acidobacteriota bacterium]